MFNFIEVSIHEKTDESTSPQIECFLIFSKCLETPMKHEARVFEIASQSKLKLRSRKRNKIVKIRGGGEATRSGTEKRCSHNLQSGQPQASQRSSKVAVCFLMISTLALSVE